MLIYNHKKKKKKKKTVQKVKILFSHLGKINFLNFKENYFNNS